MIGYYGDIIFETSDTKILNFTGLTIETAARFATHEVISSKPVTEYIGPGLGTIFFTVNLNGNNGVKPREQLEKWRALAEDGIADILVIGTKQIGKYYWVVKSISEAWNTIFNGGELFSASLNVTLEEYYWKVGS
jgi:phage protein U